MNIFVAAYQYFGVTGSVGADGELVALLLPPVHLPAACEQDAAHAGEPRGFHNVVEADEVVWKEFGEEIGVVGRGGEMDEGGDAVHGAVERGAIRDIADDAIGEARRGRAIEAAHEMAALLQLGDGGAADAAGGAGDEDGDR